MQRLHKRSAEDLFSHDVMSWMDLLHQLDSRTRGPCIGYLGHPFEEEALWASVQLLDKVDNSPRFGTAMGYSG